MADNPKKKRADGKRINIDQPHEVAYWTRRLNISTLSLALAVLAGGVTSAGVRRALAKAKRSLRAVRKARK